MRALISLLAIGILHLGPSSAAAQDNESAPSVEFHGSVVAEFLEDGRSMRLTQPFGYVDPNGAQWDVPAGAVVDGTSIPQVFWSFIGGPFEGKYRDASVVHDYYCDRRDHPWRSVHKVFYDAMIESEVDEGLAKSMYYAVYFFGPRWETIETAVVALHCTTAGSNKTCEPVVEKSTTTLALPPLPYNADSVQKDVDYMLTNNPSLIEIEGLQ